MVTPETRKQDGIDAEKNQGEPMVHSSEVQALVWAVLNETGPVEQRQVGPADSIENAGEK